MIFMWKENRAQKNSSISFNSAYHFYLWKLNFGSYCIYFQRVVRILFFTYFDVLCHLWTEKRRCERTGSYFRNILQPYKNFRSPPKRGKGWNFYQHLPHTKREQLEKREKESVVVLLVIHLFKWWWWSRKLYICYEILSPQVERTKE